MNYCSDCDIAHENGKICPLCEANDKVKGLEKEIEKLNEEIASLSEKANQPN